MPFSNFGLEKGILKAVRNEGYVQPTPIQTAAIPKALQGMDLVAIAQTGTGKTAAFAIPILELISKRKSEGKLDGTKAMVLAPTRELAVQITERIAAYGKHLQTRVATIYGGVDEASQIKAARKGVHIIVATPGRLMDLIERHKIDFSNLEILVLDEADRMLHMGFLPDIEKIVECLPRRRQTLMFSATFPREVQSLAKQFQYQPVKVQIGERINPADTVNQSVYEVPAHLKDALLVALLKDPKMARVLVFVRMKDGANRLNEFLKTQGVSTTRLHSSRSQDQRNKALQNFKDGTVRVLVATDIVARGIDIEGVSHVVNYDFPVNPEDYIHRIGRTGRAEHEGEAISLVPKHDLNLLDILEMTIKQRLKRKRLRNFDYHAKSPPRAMEARPAKKDWRKRTRELDVKKKPRPPRKTPGKQGRRKP